MRVLITGGAGFVGSNLALLLREESQENEVVAFDNLRRRGSELRLAEFKEYGIQFVHGDIRNKADLSAIPGEFDLLIEASAEPSVHCDDIDYVIGTNLIGTVNCLEFAKKRVGFFSFLSTSRVYSIPKLLELPLQQKEKRFEVSSEPTIKGLSSRGIAEDFSTEGFRSLYGSTKLSSELLIQELSQLWGLRSVINRCGVLAGPRQMGKVEQGVFSLWLARHLYEGTLKYTGFGGAGHQVRDLLHPYDLYQLLKLQLKSASTLKGQVFNVGGGPANAVSLAEWTGICQKTTGKTIQIGGTEATASVDIPYYVSDNSKVEEAFGWKPTHSPAKIAEETHLWLSHNLDVLRPYFC